MMYTMDIFELRYILKMVIYKKVTWIQYLGIHASKSRGVY